MAKKILSYILIVFGLLALGISTSKPAMEYLFAARDNTIAWWGSYQGENGDLVSMSYLDIIDRFRRVKYTTVKKPDYNGLKNTVLYLHGDSYARRLADSAFAGVEKLYLIDRNHGLNYHLDSTKRNILLIEVAERYVRTYFSNTQIIDQVCDSLIRKKNIALELVRVSNIPTYAGIGPVNMDMFFNKYINQHLQFNLFNYQFAMPLFESKAAINYYVFNRASGDVVISKDKRYLFLKETVSLTDPGSSYVALSDDDIKRQVDTFNAIYDHYKAAGFDEVYLSMIPNTASITQPEGYNMLIPKVQSHPALRMKVIDGYTAIKSSSEETFFPGDTHWNQHGRQLWLDEVNKYLIQTTAK